MESGKRVGEWRRRQITEEGGKGEWRIGNGRESVDQSKTSRLGPCGTARDAGTH